MTNNTESLYLTRVKKFISKHYSIPIAKLNHKTKLEDDLGITGDDSIEFFHLFSLEFKVDLSEMDLKNYFESEGVGLINFAWIFGKRNKHIRSFHEITISDLENILINGKWIGQNEY